MTIKRFPQESEAYERTRAELLKAEIALKDQVKRVAQLRRNLAAGPIVEDYVFHEGRADINDPSGEVREVRLSELFVTPELPLFVDHFMYGGAQQDPCPMCSMWADGYNATLRHIAQRANFALVAEAEIGKLRQWARHRSWTNIRVVSSLGTTFKDDTKMQSSDGQQMPGLSVFIREGATTVRHFYTGEAMLAEGHYNGVDLLSPVWHIFDVLPEGRGDWFPSLEY